MWRMLSQMFGDAAVATASTGRAELLRRDALVLMGLIVMLCCVLPLPVGLYLLAHGYILPMALVAIGIVVSLTSIALHRRGAADAAANTLVLGTLGVGCTLSFADPAPVDFGLAVILLAPVQAALMSRTIKRWWAWTIGAALAALATLPGWGVFAWPEPHHAAYTYLAAASFAIAALATALAARRMNSDFDTYERAQVAAYRHLIEHVQDAVVRFSTEGRAIFASRASEGLFGCARYELVGQGMLERVHVLDRPLYLTALAEATRGAAARRIEIRVRRDDPAGNQPVQFFWVEVSFSPMQGAGDGRSEVVAMFRDVTERRTHEEEMRAARELAEEASNAKSRFLATMGHELRTPLNAIVGFSEMMTSGLSGTISPAHREYAELISRSGRHLLEIVTMLLDMSRIEAGRFEVQTEAFEAETIIGPSLEMLSAAAKSKEVTLASEVQPNLPLLMADERACRQILINLVSNAVKFTPQNGKVTVRLRRHGRQIALEVVDTGIGMTSDAVRHLGEPFFQAQSGANRRFEGTGLGLSIVKGLVDLHDGQLRVRSAPGQGTTVTVLLPINGPETKSAQTGSVTPLHPHLERPEDGEWHEQRRKA